MKVRTLRSAALLATLGAVLTGTAALGAIQVVVNGNPVQFTDQQPVEMNSHVLVPLRGVLEAMGAAVRWNPAQQAVTALRGNTTVQLAVGSRDASVNNNPVTTDIPAQMIGGRVMVPLRFISEALGADVHWQDATQTVNIQTSGSETSSTEPNNTETNTGLGVPEAGNTGGDLTETINPTTGIASSNNVTPAQNAQNPAITSFTLNYYGPFHFQDSFEGVLRGTPGGEANFTLGGSKVQMAETQPGVYRGVYQIPINAWGQNIAVVAHLRVNGRNATAMRAPHPITIIRQTETGAAPGRAALPVSNDVQVTDFTLNYYGPFHPSDSFEAVLKGTPGGKAVFTVGGTTVQMRETETGVYRGVYQVPVGAQGGENISVVGRLENNGVSSPLVVAPKPITITAMVPRISQQQPPANSTVSNVKPTIYALFTPGSAPVNPGAVRLWVNNQDVTEQSTITEAFVSYTPPDNLPAGAVDVKVEIQDQTGLSSTQNWSFTVRPREGIKSLTDNARQSLGPGDVLSVTMVGEPGGQAWFSVPGVNVRVPMTETDTPGQYVGSYTVRRGDQILKQPLTGYLKVNGVQFTEKSTAPLTIWTRSAMKPVITSPANGSRVGNSIQIVGDADPDSRIEISITYVQSLLGGLLGTNGSVATETVTANKQGHFETNPISLGGAFGTGGIKYTIKVVEVDPAGQRSEPTQIQVSS